MNLRQGNPAKSRKKEVFLFFLLWIGISAGLFLFLYWMNWLPNYMMEFTAALLNPQKVASIPVVFSKESAVLVIPKIGVAAQIIFPTSTNLAVLEKAVDRGPTHYPDSALPGENGNVFIFGHSTGRPVVKNPAFTVFTNLHKLAIGDEIIVRSFRIKYIYRVSSVEVVNPDETKVYLASAKPKLTLSTCWPVGSPTNRTVVEAEFLGKSLID